MPREVLKTFPISTKDIGILKNLRSGGGHLGFLKIPSLQILQTLFRLSYEAIFWQSPSRKGIFIFSTFNENSNSDEKKKRLIGKKASLVVCLVNIFPCTDICGFCLFCTR